MPIGDHGEHTLVQLMLSEPYFWNPFLALVDTPPGAKCFAAVPLCPLLTSGEDVDVLVVNPDYPEDTVAYQVKKVKVGESTFGTHMPNGLADVRHLHRQSLALVRLGFRRVYSAVLLLVDARSQSTEKSIYASLTPEIRQSIDNGLARAAPPSGVGFIRIEYTQSFRAPVLHAGTSGIDLIRSAEAREQHSAVTTWVRDALRCYPL
jgi:hypothetical protein